MFPIWHPQDEVERHRGLSGQFKAHLSARSSRAQRHLLAWPIRDWLSGGGFRHPLALHHGGYDVMEDLRGTFRARRIVKAISVKPQDMAKSWVRLQTGSMPGRPKRVSKDRIMNEFLREEGLK